MLAKVQKVTTESDSAAKPVNHRTIVGRRRRENTETKIIHAAVQIFAERGPDAPVIDDFIKAAGIARGTFYNYFKSTDELLHATSSWVSEEIVMMIETEVESVKDPAVRFGLGIRMWVKWAQANPSWSLFIARTWNVGDFAEPVRDIREGIRKKLFLASDPVAAWDVVSGAMRQAMFRIGEGHTRRSYADAVVAMCLQALGLSSESSKKILAIELPAVSHS